jgi:hypothetical protein
MESPFSSFTPPSFMRARRRRSRLPSLLCFLILTWAVIFAGSNIARILLLPDFFKNDRWVPTKEPPRAPTFYDLLGVDPKVKDADLKKLQRNFARQYHPVSNKTFQWLLSLLLSVFFCFEDVGKRKEFCPPLFVNHSVTS